MRVFLKGHNQRSYGAIHEPDGVMGATSLNHVVLQSLAERRRREMTAAAAKEPSSRSFLGEC
jgi:hypothetical protein